MLWSLFWKRMPSRDVFSEIMLGGSGSDARSGECRHRIVSIMILFASDMLGAGLRSALRAFLRSRVPLMEFGAGVEANFHMPESRRTPSRNPTTCSLAPGDSREGPENEPHVVEVRGLRNRGQTCYANSVMQALASLPPLCAYLESTQREPRDGGHRGVSSALHRTLRHVNGHRVARRRSAGGSALRFRSLFSPHSPGDAGMMSVLDVVAGRHSQFRSRAGLTGTQEQQDSHEFLSALMDVLSEDVPESARGATDMNAANYANVGTTCDRIGESGDGPSNVCDDRAPSEQVLGYCQQTQQLEEEKKHEDCAMEHAETYRLLKGPAQSDENDQTKSTKDVDAPTSGARNPFDGWSGSAIQCASCRHISPVRSTPFLSISLPIASVRSQFLEDFLAAEYGGFAAAETVSDVQCLSCAIGERVRECKEEEAILSGAISSVRRRNRGKLQRSCSGKGDDSESDVAGLLQERQQLRRTIAILQSLDPDADDDELRCRDEENQLEIEWGIKQSLPPIVPFRGDAYKASLILRPPEVLCIHIQRRHFDMASQRMTKVASPVRFPDRLDIGPYCAYGGNSFEGQRFRLGEAATRIPYKLMSVVEHRGNAFGGHYQTYRRVDPRRNEWILASDESITRVTWNDVRGCQAYMLFYVSASR